MSTTLDRRVPPLGGFNATVISLEIRRMLRNRRTLMLSMVIPTVFFLAFGSITGDGASTLVSMAVYGAVLATTSGGATVSIERAAGWSRQLRTTPLAPPAYIAVKMATSLVLSAAAVGVVYLVAAATGKATMPVWTWIVTGVAAWLGSLLFTAFGLFVGYLMPSENVMQVIGFVLMLFSFAGGLFLPLTLFSPALRTAAAFTPMWGLNGLVHYPLTGGSFDWFWVLNLAAWLVVFTAGAAWRFSRDTARV
ncbi:ABC transporter permease [Kutzneria sp. CA-103260]|uniref:ABC transporter permease n=1 Tax=Kutzneria sp. CA-103260 TaxID=2802641 RepID=UPI001BA6AB97|nr:ABC transporter permease [Kutzneria sp. CA-103260]QUQ64809.1 ABC transporter permease [Kutzneria sp. CA-103260]